MDSSRVRFSLVYVAILLSLAVVIDANKNTCNEKLSKIFYAASICRRTVVGRGDNADTELRDFSQSSRIYQTFDCERTQNDRFFFMLTDLRVLEIRKHPHTDKPVYRFFKIDAKEMSGKRQMTPYHNFPGKKEMFKFSELRDAYYNIGFIIMKSGNLHLESMELKAADPNHHGPIRARVYDSATGYFHHRKIGSDKVDSVFNQFIVIRDFEENIVFQHQHSICANYIHGRYGVGNFQVVQNRKKFFVATPENAADSNSKGQAKLCPATTFDRPIPVILSTIMVNFVLYALFVLYVTRRVKLCQMRLAKNRTELLMSQSTINQTK